MDAIGSGVLHLNPSGFRLRSASHNSPASCPQASVSFVHGTSISCSSEGSRNLNKSLQPLTFSLSDLADRNGILGSAYLSEPVHKRGLVGQTFCSAGVCTFPETAFGVPSQTTHEKVGVLLLNLGGPETLHDVQPFLFNLFADPDIIRLPRLFRFLQRPLAQLISVLRAPKSKEGYASIGGGSPLRRITDEQALALKVALEAKKMHVNVYVGMRYWHPFTEEAVHQIKKDGITKLVVLPLYPQYSISTSGSSIRLLQSIFSEDSYLARLPVSIIKSWYQREGYIKSMANLIEKELQSFSKPEEVMIFFSAHGVPVSYVEDAGDPYRDQMEDCISLIMEELKSRGIANSHTLAYQSRVGPVQWLKPYTDEVIVTLGQNGVKSLLAVPISFVSEHIETLEEIDMEYRELALESGIENWGRVPALGCTSSFISDLGDAVIEALPSAIAMSTANDTSREADLDPLRSAIKLFFGSILAFFLMLSPKLISTFKNYLH
ncbi:ferrochelatase-2, chloroplastic-like [Magnolia sinica]|uniref:ferrochelatase-2, chloroplastic-like n=1 Tax=Magnolia sinica TaxID=86752 RepID=UPI00265B5955|nr:ferrochelatase-2, chloroplastic-like [Magnolia sinica]XP_058074038.1 ferrochelatase-2, chloroplastic-like [Magnolia sinica]XP_058074039.1 ferrochelatase-2, chloroplastic-like [Magnolia sinica]